MFFGGWQVYGIGGGIRALREIKQSNESGKALAIIGIVTGIGSIALYIYFEYILKW